MSEYPRVLWCGDHHVTAGSEAEAETLAKSGYHPAVPDPPHGHDDRLAAIVDDLQHFRADLAAEETS